MQLGKKQKNQYVVSLLQQKITTIRPNVEKIAKAKQHKKAQYGSKAVPGKKDLSSLFEETSAIKKQLKPAKAENPKKRKFESLVSTEINLTHSSNKMEEYFFIPPTISRTRSNPVENSHSTTELVVSLNVKS